MIILGKIEDVFDGCDNNLFQHPTEQENIDKIFQYFYGIMFPTTETETETETKNIPPLFAPEKIKKTFHMYETDLPEETATKIRIIKNNIILNHICKIFNKTFPSSFFRYKVLPITQMNELYLSKLNSEGSDQIFESPHVDGPFFFLPFCNVYRCILGISNNDIGIITHFPNQKIPVSYPFGDKKYPYFRGVINPPFQHKYYPPFKGTVSKQLEKYEYVAFDYNRDIHYISGGGETYSSASEGDETKTETDELLRKKDASSSREVEPRIIFKLHYMVYPSFLPSFVVFSYKWTHIHYNSFMRFLFVRSQSNKSYVAKFINWGNYIFCSFYRRLNR